MIIKRTVNILFMFLLIILAACSGTDSSVKDIQPTVIPSEIITKTVIESIVVIPTKTPVSTPTRTPTQKPTNTITLTPTEIVNFDSIRIIGVENFGDYISVIFEFLNIKDVYKVTINGIEYSCLIPEGVVDRLFCSGNAFGKKEYVDVKFFSPEATENALYAVELYVPEPYKTPLPVGDPSTWCPQRGQNISCETEHRVENGEECWVQTCVDACGYYYSYHTCQLPPNNNFLPP